MQYLALIYSDESAPPENRAPMEAWYAFGTKHRAVILGGDALQPVATATTLRKGDDGILATEGPFAETREALGGYYLLECRDLAHALEVAEDIPIYGTGCVEVRPILVLPSM